MANDLKLNLILKATDGLSSVVKSACTQSDKAFEKMNNTLKATGDKFNSVGQKSALFGGALLAASAVNVKMAANFEQSMNSVSTLIDTNVESLESMKKEVLAIAKESPKSLNDLTEGLYSIRSAGIEASAQFDVLKGSEKLAVAGLATTAEAVDIATSTINAFSLKGEEANNIYDMFFKVVKYGKTNVSEFAQGFGAVAGVVASANIKVDEYSAAVAAMTTSGVKASIAHTQLKAAIAGLSRGSKDQMEIFNKLGASSFSDLVQKSGGMVNAFNKINKAVGGNQSKLIGLLGSVEAYNAVLSLTGARNAKFVEALNDMRNGENAIDEAYQKQMAGLNNTIAALTNNFQALSIRLGTALTPAINAISGAISNVTGLIDKMPDGLVNFISISTAVVAAISLVGGTGLMVIGNLLKSFVVLRTFLRGFSIAAWANPALLPIIGITAVVVALGAAAVYCYNKFEGFRNCCQALWAVVQTGGAWIAVLANGFINGAVAIWNFISPAVKFAATIASWLTPIGLVYHAIHGLVNIIGNLIQKAGGLRAIGSSIKNWAQNANAKANEINASVKAKRKPKADGSHLTGLNYVPYDGYIAETHKGEAILTKREASDWRSKKSASNNNENYTISFNPTINISGETKSNTADYVKKAIWDLAPELTKYILATLARKEARSY